MTKQQIISFIERISDPKEREEWIAFVGERYEEGQAIVRKGVNQYRKKYPERTREYTRTKVMRAAVARSPRIAFDLFDGHPNYPARSHTHAHWFYKIGKMRRRICRSCGERAYAKPLAGCREENHYHYYESQLISHRRHRERNPIKS